MQTYEEAVAALDTAISRTSGAVREKLLADKEYLAKAKDQFFGPFDASGEPENPSEEEASDG